MRIDASEQEKNSYAAGFLDGEGCIGIQCTLHEERAYYGLHVQINNVNEDVINWLWQNYSGGYKSTRKSDVNKNRQQSYSWDIQSEPAYQFLQKVYRYAIVKRKQVELAFSFMNRQYNDSGESFYLQTKVLNKRGIKP